MTDRRHLTEQEREEPVRSVCPNCGGDGWYLDHEDSCYEKGDCSCSGVQVQCECQRA